LFEAAHRDLGDLSQQFERGEFQPLHQWLTTKIHRPGRQYPALKLVERVTGEPLSHRPLMRHLQHKLGALYGI
jgi:carboxypeptidase Taq